MSSILFQGPIQGVDHEQEDLEPEHVPDNRQEDLEPEHVADYRRDDLETDSAADYGQEDMELEHVQDYGSDQESESSGRFDETYHFFGIYLLMIMF